MHTGHVFGHADTNKGLGAGRDLFCERVEPRRGLFPRRTCPIHFFGHAGTNKGRGAGRDLFRERVEAFGAVALLFEGPALVLDDVGDLQLLAEVFEHLWHAFVCQTCDNNAQWFRGGLVSRIIDFCATQVLARE